MSTTTTASTATNTACGTSFQYELPVKDAACGVPQTDNYNEYLSKCAEPAGVSAYNHDCAIYNLAVDQSVEELTDCLYDAGVDWKDVWCYSSTNATATATSYPTSSETSSAFTADSEESPTFSSTSGTGNGTSGAAALPNAHIGLKAIMVMSTLFASVIFPGV